jgi:histone H1/5
MAGTEVVAAAEVAEGGVVLTGSEMGKPEKVVVLKEKKVKAVVSKEMKMKTTKAGNVAAAHPSYLLMVKEAIGSLKERTGSSQHAIAKYLEEVYKTGLPPNFKKILSVRLRNMTKQGKVYKVKNSFKLSEELKKPMMIRRKAGPNKSTLSIKGDSNNKEIELLKPIKAPRPKSQNRVKKTTKTTIIDGVPVPKSPKPAKAPKAPKFENKRSKLTKPGTNPRKLSLTATKKGEEKKFTPPALAAAAAATTTKPALVASLTSKKASGVRKTAAKKLLTPKKSTKSVKTSKSKAVMKALPGAPSNKAVAKKAKK